MSNYSNSNVDSGMKAGSNSSTGDNGIVYGSIFQPVASATRWAPGITDDWNANTLSNTTRKFTQGSWVSAPSEDLGFWFSGLRAAGYEDINYEVSSGDSDQANTSATDFIKFNLQTPGQASSLNMTWPAGVEPRAEGALVWLPYGNKGMLVAFGGIGTPADLQVSGLFPTYNDTTGTNNYMNNVLVYDIDSDTWDTQQTATTGANPTQRASFCWVAASTTDNSSHHIYVYGGYDGTYQTTSSAIAYDEMWVLSIPAFRWTKLSDGNPSHRRQNHVCVQMNPTTMLSIGGNLEYGQALNDTAFDVYDLSAAQWTSTYKPDSTAKYSVPDAISKSVGDLSTIPSDLTSRVKTWLGAPYKKNIVGPILDSCPTTSSPPATSSSSSPNPVGMPTWEKAVIAVVVVLGVAFLAGIFWFCCVRNRRRGNDSDDTKRNSILSWVHKSSGNPAAPKSMPDSENTVIATPVNDYFGKGQGRVEAYEMPSNVPSPGYNSTYGHGSPQIIAGGSASSPLFGSAEVDAQSRHEMGSGSSTGYPYDNISRSVSGHGNNNMMSLASETMSHTSGPIMHSRHYGYVSPYEMAHDRSHEDLTPAPNDLVLNEPKAEANKNASTHSLGVGAEQMLSPAALTPATPVSHTTGAAEVVDENRSRHQRNQSSITSNLPNLPSPGLEEDRRRSKLLETLPDMSSGSSSPAQSPNAKRSAYKENLES